MISGDMNILKINVVFNGIILILFVLNVLDFEFVTVLFLYRCLSELNFMNYKR